ncbi:hypothetical protein FAZ95_36495 [Trinickia violacea]|uniref:Uncharacterized protein n=1 Tax=Trinickia violacea TaxID=2571746 RepID=A0A4P8J3H3_9BURK|nr:hypothetical protein [Trinickia violacea]QCP54424.1 hypothetical protein FAZ95_36495 [Trinickia violacea]
MNINTATSLGNASYTIPADPVLDVVASSVESIRDEGFEVLLRHAQEEAHNLHERIERLGTEISATRVEKKIAEKKVERLTSLVDELRMLRTNIVDSENAVEVKEPVTTLASETGKPRRPMRIWTLAVIALVIVAALALGYLAFDGREFDFLFERLRALHN